MARCACGSPSVPGNSRGECGPCWRARVRSAAIHYAPSRSKGAIDPTKQRQWDRDLAEYAKVRKEGSQPKSTNRSDVERAKKLSDEVGRAVSAEVGV